MKKHLITLIETSLAALNLDEIINTEKFAITIETPKHKDHGDFSTNVALLLAKHAKKNPRELAQAIIEKLPQDDAVKDVTLAGPGFINFFVNENAHFDLIHTILEKGDTFGTSSWAHGEPVHIEFVSANPTGPLHVGHGRGAAYGSAVANLLKAVGYNVWREYYVNDAGRQMHILATSVWLRYLELQGLNFTFPKNAYRGDYIISIAKDLKKEFKQSFMTSLDSLYENVPEDEHDTGGDKEAHIDALVHNAQTILGEHYQAIFQRAKNAILDDIKEDLAAFGVTYEAWFSEQSLSDQGTLQQCLDKLTSLKMTYKKDGALWFESTKYGDDKDRVLVRADGRTTYFCSDVAYHFNKIERGYNAIIDVLGADHHGYVPRIRASMQALGIDDQHFKAPLVQFAILYRGKEKVQMSTRSGAFVTLRELREEVGTDAARYFYIMRKAQQHMDFDLELAKSKTNENPVYYIQYAHARITSVFEKLKRDNREFNQKKGLGALEALSLPQEIQLAKQLACYPDMITQAAKNLEPHLLANYLRELAQAFHAYYNAEKVIIDDDALCQARCCLILAVKTVLKNGLSLLGISAPDTM